MKFRNFIILLLAVLMVFAFASCNNEPGKKSEPAKLYKLTATTGRNTSWNGADKFSLVWGDEEVESGDKLSLKFRSTAEISSFSIRNDSCAWVYEQTMSKLTSYEPGEDGWYSIVYEFSDTFLNGEKTEPDYGKNTTGFRIDLRGNILEGDVIEYKDVALNGVALPVEEGNVAYHSESSKNENKVHPGVYGAVDPTLEVIENHAWTQPTTHVVFFATSAPGDANLPFAFERVENNTAFKTDLAKANYSFTLFSDSAFITPFEKDTPITADKTIFVKYTGVPVAVKFMDGETELINLSTTVPYNGHATRPNTDPEKASFFFDDWYADAEGNTKFDFDATVITEETTIYARWATATWNVTFKDGETELTDLAEKITDGSKATEPTKPTKDGSLFRAWYKEKALTNVFDFATETITGDTILYAGWDEAVTVKLHTTATEPEEYVIVKGTAFEEPTKHPNKPGFYFAKWTTTDDPEAAAYNFETLVNGTDGVFDLYAQWTAPTKIQKVTIYDGYAEDKDNYDRFQLSFADTVLHVGDVVQFQFRSTREFDYGVSLRATDGTKSLYYSEIDDYISDADANGWITFTYTIPAKGVADFNQAKFDDGFYLCLHGFTVTTDVLEVKAFTVNGDQATITSVKHGTAEDIDDHVWVASETYVVCFFTERDVMYKGALKTDYEKTVTSTAFVVNSGEHVSPIADPVWEDHVFNGWSTKKKRSEQTTTFDFANTEIDENTRLYAIWD